MQQEELTRQIKDMKAQGMGGFFMHSRDGLETPYMGPEWMEAIRESVAQAEQQGMKAWLYDEDRWPSGSAGGQVPAIGDEHRSKGLTIEVARGSFQPDGAIVAVFKAAIDDMKLLRCEQLQLPEIAGPAPKQPHYWPRMKCCSYSGSRYQLRVNGLMIRRRRTA